MRPALVAEDDPTLLLRTVRTKRPRPAARNDGLGPTMRPALVPVDDRTLTAATGLGSGPQEVSPRAGEKGGRAGVWRWAVRRGRDGGWLALAPSILLPSRSAFRVERLARGCDHLAWHVARGCRRETVAPFRGRWLLTLSDLPLASTPP